MKKVFLGALALSLFTVSCKQNQTESVTDTAAENTEPAAPEIQHQLEWTAYKTPAKAGVHGSFDNIMLQANEGDSLEDQLKGATFTIGSATVNSGDEGRDATLKEQFFAKMAGDISGSFGDFADNKVNLNITMNNVNKAIPFTYEKSGDTLIVKGKVDIIADFAADTALGSLAEACKVQHEDKTWSDVDLEAKFYK